MNLKQLLKSSLLVGLVALSGQALAYSPEELEKACKKPRFTDFNLPIYKAPDNIEVAPKSEFIIKISAWVDPTTITLTAKKQPLAFELESTSTFHKIKAQLPAELSGEFVRIDVGAKAVLGCDDKTGWLIKVADH